MNNFKVKKSKQKVKIQKPKKEFEHFEKILGSFDESEGINAADQPSAVSVKYEMKNSKSKQYYSH